MELEKSIQQAIREDCRNATGKDEKLYGVCVKGAKIALLHAEPSVKKLTFQLRETARVSFSNTTGAYKKGEDELRTALAKVGVESKKAADEVGEVVFKVNEGL